jgi:hypothetical protein
MKLNAGNYKVRNEEDDRRKQTRTDRRGIKIT